MALADAGIEATVELVEELGEARIVHAALADGSSVALRHHPESAPAAGTAVRLAFDPAACHFFDGEGVRIEAGGGPGGGSVNPGRHAI